MNSQLRSRLAAARRRQNTVEQPGMTLDQLRSYWLTGDTTGFNTTVLAQIELGKQRLAQALEALNVFEDDTDG